HHLGDGVGVSTSIVRLTLLRRDIPAPARVRLRRQDHDEAVLVGSGLDVLGLAKNSRGASAAVVNDRDQGRVRRDLVRNVGGHRHVRRQAYSAVPPVDGGQLGRVGRDRDEHAQGGEQGQARTTTI